MKDFKILGPMSNCKTTTALIETVAREKGVESVSPKWWR